jgi:DedD protein
LTTQAQDDGFHEIQLNGKQLVFLFMAATVVSVVIFLCGVLVGRGVRAERSVAVTDSSAVLPESPAPPAAAPASAPASAEQPSATAPPVPPEDNKLSYSERLNEGDRKETLKPAPVPEKTVAEAAPRPVPPPPPVAEPAPSPKATVPATKERDTPAAVPALATSTSRADGYAIQVAALRESGEADTIAKRLVSKGYDAYVLTPPGGTPSVYRVRIGSFKTRRDAEAIAAKLQREEQFKPWITR